MAEPDTPVGPVGQIPLWHHVDCFIPAMAHLEVTGVTAHSLTGFTKLKKPDKELLAQKLGGSVTAKKSAKRSKRVAAEETSVPVKKMKTEPEEGKLLKAQSEMVWKMRDGLQRGLKTADLRSLLEANNQRVPSGESKVLDRCSDGMVFGALLPCDQCGGQLAYSGNSYSCTGNLTAWTKCTNRTGEPDREPWCVPAHLKEDHPFLQSYRFKPHVRAFASANLPPGASCDAFDGPGGSGGFKGLRLPLTTFTFLLQGKFKPNKKALAEAIKELGGTLLAGISHKVGLCLVASGDGALEQLSTKALDELEEKQIPVLSESFITAVKEKGSLVPMVDHLLSSWGQNKVKSMDKFGGQLKETGSKSIGKSFGPQLSKVKKFAVKGGAVVDSDSGLDATHHVYEAGGVIYNAVLGMVDIQRGSNSFYKLQVLESDKKEHYSLFRSWGRVGTSIGGSKLERYGRLSSEAIEQFEELYESKTGNCWGNSKNFVKHPNKFYPLEIDYGQEDEAMSEKMATAGTSSTLDPAIQKLIKMIFDIDSMKNVMLEFEIDVRKMPLGKLSKKQIGEAYKVLTEAIKELGGARNPAKLLDASNRFYTLIPHDFGLQSPPLLDNEEIIKNKTEMLDNLLEIEVAYSLLRGEASEGRKKDPIDANYDKLHTDIGVLSKDGEEYKMIAEYVSNTHAPTHSGYTLELLDAFKIQRHGEDKRYKPFKKLPNRKLLWHGSRATNFAGILSQGLRIAPPEAPQTGYMFGKGVYFADMVSKSANYCFTSRSRNSALLLLCEVALGNIYERTQAEYVTKLPDGKHSCKGLGYTQPDPSGSKTLPGGTEVPMGTATGSGTAHTSLLYNEYIVYDVAQISMQYLLKVNFNYK